MESLNGSGLVTESLGESSRFEDGLDCTSIPVKRYQSFD